MSFIVIWLVLTPLPLYIHLETYEIKLNLFFIKNILHYILYRYNILKNQSINCNIY